jgi:chemotaxis protein CheD
MALKAHAGTDRAAKLPPVLPQFSHIRRFWDAKAQLSTAKILPGEFYVTQSNEAINTVLGSCVSACIRDVKARAGGMNHFMLPISAARSESEDAWKDGDAARYGNVAMEMLINELQKLGARRERLEVKLVGGGHVLHAGADIGERNIAFVREFVRVEGLKVVAEDLGGFHPRRVYYTPVDGRVRVKALGTQDKALVAEEENYLARVQHTPVDGSVELF